MLHVTQPAIVNVWSTVSCTVQLYYAYRVYVLSQLKILVLAIGLVRLTLFGGLTRTVL